MTTPTSSPIEMKNLDGYGSPPLEWERVIQSLDKTRDLDALDAAGRYWLATTGSDGSPHVMPVGIIWDRGRFYFTTGAGTQKGRNLARDPHCVITVAALGTDVVVKGTARIIRDEAELRRIAALFTDWGPEIRDGAFWHEYSAPSAGPPPWDVYEVVPETVYGLSTAEPHGATRWRLLA